MIGIKNYAKRMMICWGMTVACTGIVMAQKNTEAKLPTDSVAAAELQELRKGKEAKVTKLTVKERLAFRANMVGWVLATPSVGVQYDMTPWDYNKWTLGADVKWNPGSNQTFVPGVEYKMLDARIEARKYFRESLTIKPGQKRMPKYWRAYYWGVYAGYTDYTLYLREGYTGRHFGIGGTAGWEIPLITFATGGLDLDLGLSAGWIYGESKKRIDDNGYKFTNVKDRHFTPYPVISEVRVALVYRFNSVKEKYNRSKR